MTIRERQKQIHAWALSKGWWTPAFGANSSGESNPGTLTVTNRDHLGVLAEKLLLITTEIAEATEEYRNGRALTSVYFTDPAGAEHAYQYRTAAGPVRKPEGFPTEIADAMIRLMDLGEACGIDLDDEIDRKMEYNETRAYRHGGKLL